MADLAPVSIEDFVDKTPQQLAQIILSLPLGEATQKASGQKNIGDFLKFVQASMSDPDRHAEAIEKSGDDSIALHSILLYEALATLAQTGEVPTATQRESLRASAQSIVTYADANRFYVEAASAGLTTLDSLADAGDLDDLRTDLKAGVINRDQALYDLLGRILGNTNNVNPKLVPDSADSPIHASATRMVTHLNEQDTMIGETLLPLMQLINKALNLGKQHGLSH